MLSLPLLFAIVGVISGCIPSYNPDFNDAVFEKSRPVEENIVTPVAPTVLPNEEEPTAPIEMETDKTSMKGKGTTTEMATFDPTTSTPVTTSTEESCSPLCQTLPLITTCTDLIPADYVPYPLVYNETCEMIHPHCSFGYVQFPNGTCMPVTLLDYTINPAEFTCDSTNQLIYHRYNSPLTAISCQNCYWWNIDTNTNIPC